MTAFLSHCFVFSLEAIFPSALPYLVSWGYVAEDVYREVCQNGLVVSRKPSTYLEQAPWFVPRTTGSVPAGHLVSEAEEASIITALHVCVCFEV